MPNFVDDMTDLDFPKESRRVTAPGMEDRSLRASDWNRICQAAYDLRDAVLDLEASTADLPLSQIADIASARVLGRTTAGPGEVEELTGAQVTALLDDIAITQIADIASATVLGRTTAGPGEVEELTGADVTSLIDDLAITQIADIATDRFLGRTTVGPGEVEELTGTQATELLDAFASGTKGVVPASGGGTGTLLNSDATWTSNSIVISQSAIASTNLSTLGTLDWLFPPNATTNPRSIAINTVHNKTAGGVLMPGWDWQSVGATAFTQAGSETWSSDASDDQLGSALNTTTTAGFFTASGVLTGFGFRFTVPAATYTQVVRIYVQNFSSVVTCQARLKNSTDSPVSDTFDSGANTASGTVFAITYRANQPTLMTVVVYVSTNHGFSPNIKIAGVSLGLV